MSNYTFNYHIYPKSGFLNDPNGLAQFKGKYHVFYQWLEEVTPQGAKCWGHYVSTDLVHWKDQGIALHPDSWYDKNGVYSGSAIVHEDTLYLFYTGNVRNSRGERESYQCLATSEDGENFKKHGPVIEVPKGYTAHFRDPKVWKDKENNYWWMVIGAQTQELKGNVVLYGSYNLEDWEYKGNILPEQMNWGYMCECPDLIELQGNNYLLVSKQEKIKINEEEIDQSIAVYLPGEFSQEIPSYAPLSDGIRLDEGFDYYAPQTFLDDKGRRLLIAWMGGGEIDYQLSQPTVNEGWLHGLTIPRELVVFDKTLYQKPVDELALLRANKKDFMINNEEKHLNFTSKSIELLVENRDCSNLKIKLFHTVIFTYDSVSKSITIKRQNWLTNQYDSNSFYIETDLETCRIFIDCSSVEIFINHGEKVLTMRAYFEEENNKVYFGSNKSLKISSWDLVKEES
ncbi:sucrose-6-phosphate hydrolase [Oceanobacillus jeddahense]|uniref:Sucrose-6-phosphate hydrolase n=1 Tax=Oceanobacillus jeddahense TaxID=1462527 RepID=A0ABY5JTR9_9BACI|nr:sucrose-6-phosphate hydrolase [Oceanobacillus jeddahense]UUI03723.1 sucrose-6-phosphate hydrolase [Oceanobacillus jeddahense]